MTDRSNPRSTGAGSGGMRLRRAVPEFAGWALIAIGALLAIVAIGAGTGAVGAAALLAAGVALLIVARTDGLVDRVRDMLTEVVRGGRPVTAQSGAAVPHHRATRALLGETVKALNGADPAAPWTIERDGAWASAEVFDYAIYRRHEGAPPERVAIEVDPAAGDDVSGTALRVASSFSAGGGLYDAVLVVAADLDDRTASQLERLVSRLCGSPCVALAVTGDSTDPARVEAEILAIAEALEHVTSSQRASAPRTAARPAQPRTERPAAARTPEPERAGAALAWSTPAADEPRTAPAPAPAATDDFAALLQGAETEAPAPSRRSRSQR